MDWQSFIGGSLSPIMAGGASLLFLLVILWTLVWKGLALWKAAGEKSKVWFIILLVVNTVGILDILYLYVFSRKSNKSEIPPPEASRM